MTLSGKENNLHACARCGLIIIGQVAIDDEEFGAKEDIKEDEILQEKYEGD